MPLLKYPVTTEGQNEFSAYLQLLVFQYQLSDYFVSY